MISVLSIPRSYAEVIPEIGMSQLALDHSSGTPSRDISTACACPS
jgi:hypothetical protein